VGCDCGNGGVFPGGARLPALVVVLLLPVGEAKEGEEFLRVIFLVGMKAAVEWCPRYPIVT